jgi:hypothetical protein
VTDSNFPRGLGDSVGVNSAITPAIERIAPAIPPTVRMSFIGFGHLRLCGVSSPDDLEPLVEAPRDLLVAEPLLGRLRLGGFVTQHSDLAKYVEDLTATKRCPLPCS